MKKKYGAAVIVLGLLSVGLLQNMEQFAVALNNVQGGGTRSSKPQAAQTTAAQQDARLKELQKKAKNNLTLQPQEASDILIEYLVIRFTQMFQEMANKLGDALIRISDDQSAGQAIKRLPQAAGDAVWQLYRLTKTIATKEYIESLKALRKALKCFLNKAAREGADCTDYKTANAALIGVFEHVKKFFLPLAQALVLGVKMGDRQVQGWVPLGVGIIAPDSQVATDLKVTTDLINTIFNITDQLKDIVPKS